MRSVEFTEPRLDRFAYVSQHLSEAVIVLNVRQDAMAGVEQLKQLVDLGILGQFHGVMLPPSRRDETRLA